jgi:hypothetical protein
MLTDLAGVLPLTAPRARCWRCGGVIARTTLDDLARCAELARAAA